MSEQDAAAPPQTTTLIELTRGCLKRNGRPKRPLPIAPIISPRRTGKTSLLDQLEKEFAESAPHARINVGESDADPIAILSGLTSQLHPNTRYVGAISFPLFGLGLLALDLDPTLGIGQRKTALKTILRSQHHGNDLAAILQPTLDGLADNLPPNERAGVQIASLAAGWLGRYADEKRIDKMLERYAKLDSECDRGGNDSLYKLCEWYTDAVNAWQVDKTLCAALLADLRAHFDHWRPTRPWQPITNILVLLDNTGGDKGIRFLQTLAECRREMPHVGDPLVVVADHNTRPKEGLIPEKPYKAVVKVTGATDAIIQGPPYEHWLEQTEKQPIPALWYPIQLVNLDSRIVQHLVSSRTLDGEIGHDADFIRELTGGHLGSTIELGKKLSASEPGFDPRDILNDHDRLLRQLMPRSVKGAMLDAMSICAATRKPRIEACEATFQYLPDGLRQAMPPADDAYDELVSTLWAVELTDDSLDLHPLVRRLLVSRLADGPIRWKEVHAGFQTYYRNIKDHNAVWYHGIAYEEPRITGEMGHLITHMNERLVELWDTDERLDERSQDKWCRELDAITAAPNLLRTRDDPRNVVSRLTGSQPAEGFDQQRTVPLVIVGQWLYNDRVFNPRHELSDLLATEYGNLARRFNYGAEFARRAQEYRKAAKEWGWRN